MPSDLVVLCRSPLFFWGCFWGCISFEQINAVFLFFPLFLFFYPFPVPWDGTGLCFPSVRPIHFLGVPFGRNKKKRKQPILKRNKKKKVRKNAIRPATRENQRFPTKLRACSRPHVGSRACVPHTTPVQSLLTLSPHLLPGTGVWDLLVATMDPIAARTSDERVNECVRQPAMSTSDAAPSSSHHSIILLHRRHVAVPWEPRPCLKTALRVWSCQRLSTVLFCHLFIFFFLFFLFFYFIFLRGKQPGAGHAAVGMTCRRRYLNSFSCASRCAFDTTTVWLAAHLSRAVTIAIAIRERKLSFSLVSRGFSFSFLFLSFFFLSAFLGRFYRSDARRPCRHDGLPRTACTYAEPQSVPTLFFPLPPVSAHPAACASAQFETARS